MSNQSITYKDAGVDIDAANETVHRIRDHVRSTFTPSVLSDVGSFGGMFALSALADYAQPILVSSMDGVGTKVKVAADAMKHVGIGHDLVNHCVNDILVQGARPLFFLDYFATGKLVPSVTEEVVRGLSEACKAVGCALIGGETAEMPGIYPVGSYDLAGTIVGVVERDKVLDGTKVEVGDLVVGISSSGLHTNGFSLARRVLFDCDDPMPLFETIPSLGRSLAEELLIPHRCYAPLLFPVLEEFQVHALAHITGGGLYDNIPRVIPSECYVNIERRTWPIPPIFSLIQQRGDVPDSDMFRTFNMGIGMVAILPAEFASGLAHRLNEAGCPSSIIGEVRRGGHGVEIM